MARISIEDCLKHEGNRFALIYAAIKRAVQLKKGATPLVNAPGEKETVVGLREIAKGKVEIVKDDRGNNLTENSEPI